MKNVTCPNCNNYGSVGTMEDMSHNFNVKNFGSKFGDMIELAFRQRGRVEGMPFWVCNKCDSGLMIKTFGEPELIVGKRLMDMEEEWELNTDSKF